MQGSVAASLALVQSSNRVVIPAFTHSLTEIIQQGEIRVTEVVSRSPSFIWFVSLTLRCAAVIGKGQLRFGSLTQFGEHAGWAWRHWGCVTSRQFTNICNTHSDAEQIEGFNEISAEDQERVKTAFQYRSGQSPLNDTKWDARC